MDITLIKKLIKVVEDSDITEFSVEEGDLKLKISKASKEVQTQQYIQPMQAPMPQQANIQIAPATQKSEEVEIEKADPNLVEVKSPIVGTFYRSPAPDADPYVQIGDKVSEGNVLCIVEAMKLMNEIESDVSGTIVKVLVENATPVEYNQPLFLVKKD